jgi:Protein of unknown function (DUF669).
MASLNFNASTVPPQENFAPIPAGNYIAVIVDSEIKPTKNNSGTVAAFTWKVLDGQFAGRKLFGRINIRNANSEAERIGQSQLSALCHAAGVLQLQDTQQLHGRPVQIRVKVRKDETGRYEDQNEVTGYAAAPGGTAQMPMSTPAQSSGAPAQAAAPSAEQAPARATPPWARAA